jgi:sterol desaturase/sphingolipid hydroxylase (fatty acid hydroxylase superfamily)
MWLFWLPLILLGFDPKLVLAVVAINLGFQFFVHTRAGRHWGALGYVFNTPSWHRVHHACNDIYIDKNFAGVLVIWDRLFGTFEAEHQDIPCRFGITDDFESDNPLTITFHEWQRMLTDAAATPGLVAKSKVLLGPPRPEKLNTAEELTS